MAQNYRDRSNAPEGRRGGRYQTSSEHDRYRTGGEQRFSPDWQDRDRQERGFEGDRSYSRGGYSEEFGYRRGQNRDDNNDRELGSRYYGSRGASGANYQSGRSYGGDYDREGQSRYDEGRYDEGNRFTEASEPRRSHDDRDFGDAEFTFARNRGTSTSRWHADEGDDGGYFNTGSYIDDGGAGRGFGRDFERARARVQQENDFGSYRDQNRETSGDYRNYGRSSYGSQSNYGRGQSGEHQWQSRQAGSYGTESFRGRGPQGYQRSDERLKEVICERLTDDPAIDASNVTVEVTGQCVKLTGSVDDRSTKYEIEELVENFGGVKDIDNQLRVRSQQSGLGQSSSGGNAQTGQQMRGGSDWEAGSSSTSTSTGRGGAAGTSSGASTGSPSAGSTGRKN